MSNEFKAVVVITNHFKEQPVNPKIVFGNCHFLATIGYSLDEIGGADPSLIFTNWVKDEFVQEIVACVDNKVSWTGFLNVKNKQGKVTKREFTITPVYDLSGSINFYSCCTMVKNKHCAKNKDGNITCLDDYLNSMTEYYTHFQQACVLAPENFIKLDLSGNITFINQHAQDQFYLETNFNIFDSLDTDKDRVMDFINDTETSGKVRKIEFDIITGTHIASVKCKCWANVNEQNEVVGHSLSLTDVTKKRNVAKQLMALRGV